MVMLARPLIGIIKSNDSAPSAILTLGAFVISVTDRSWIQGVFVSCHKAP